MTEKLKKQILPIALFTFFLVIIFPFAVCIISFADSDDIYSTDSAVITGRYSNDIVAVSKTQIGYKELSVSTGEPLYNGNGIWYTKYGERFNNSSGAWCAFFVMWCAEKAGIPKSVIPQTQACGNCGVFMDWFKNNGLWQNEDYIPSTGDIIFFDWNNDDRASHVGIVERVGADGEIYTVEGNVCADSDGRIADEGYYQVVSAVRTESIMGYGTPDYALSERINGTVTSGGKSAGKAYMLPDISSNTVWYADTADRVIILCEDGDFYLLLYPFLSTGRYVIGYLPKDIVKPDTEIRSAEDYYNINRVALLSEDTNAYHNPSVLPLMNGSTDERVRAVFNKEDTVRVLFALDGYYFAVGDSQSGFIDMNAAVFIKEEDTLDMLGDLNADGCVTEEDGILILKYSVGLVKLSNEQLSHADTDLNGIINAADAARIFINIKKSGGTAQ